MLAKVPWQSINRAIESNERRHARMILRQASLLDLRFELQCMGKIATGKKMGKTVDDARRKIGRFSDFPRCAASAVTHHVRGHRGAVFAVAPINFLDHCFASLADAEIDQDIGPSYTTFVQ